MTKLFRGPVFSMPMFFNSDQSLDIKALEIYTHKICNVPDIQAVYSMSYNTRYMQLSDDEIVFVNTLIYNICESYSIPFICGHPITCTQNTLLDYLRKLDLAGKATISVLYPERYFNIKDQLLEYHFAPVSLGYNILIHEMKLVSGFDGSLVDWDLNLLDELLSHEKVIGLKEDSKNDAIAGSLLDGFSKTKNIIIAGGGKRRAMTLREKGIKTWLNGSFMMFPELSGHFMKAWNNNNEDALEQYIELIEAPLFDGIINFYGWHVGHKAVLAARGFCELEERSPMPVVSQKEMNNILQSVRTIEENSRMLLS